MARRLTILAALVSIRRTSAIAGRQKALQLGWKLVLQPNEARHSEFLEAPAPTYLPKRDSTSLRLIDLRARHSDRIPVHHSDKFLAVIYHHKMYRDWTIEHC